MKIIYSDPETYQAYLEQDAGKTRIATETSVFDGMADEDIMTQRYVPQGYVFYDELTGLHYHGQATMPLEGGDRFVVKMLRNSIDSATTVANHAQDDVTSAQADITDTQMALADVYEMLEALTAEVEAPVEDEPADEPRAE